MLLVHHDAHASFPPQPPDAGLADLGAELTQLARIIRERRADGAIIATLSQTQSRCAPLGGPVRPEAQVLLATLHEALEAWRRVWPRLGTQEEFRLAVAREADLWARRLFAFARRPPASSTEC